MRSSRPMPGNPWPHDMVIRITEDESALLELLWVRAVWALDPPGTDLPPRPIGLPSFDPSVQRLRLHKHDWEQAWAELWPEVLGHIARPRDPSNELAALRAAASGSNELAELMAAFRGPSWRLRFDDTPFDDAYSAWESELSEQVVARAQTPLDEDPERRCLSALVPAWHRGLTTIITIPCEGEYTRTVGAHALLVTVATRSDPDRYGQALERFAAA